MNAHKKQTTALTPLLRVLTVRAALPVPVTLGIAGMESCAQVCQFYAVISKLKDCFPYFIFVGVGGGEGNVSKVELYFVVFV